MNLRIFPKKRIFPKIKPKTWIFYPFEYYAKLDESFEIKEAESLEMIKNHLKAFTRSYVPSSHGKDSVVMVHLVMRAWRELIKEGYNIRKPEVWLNHTLNVYKEEPPYWKVINKFLEIEDVFKIFYPPKYKNGKYKTVWSIIKDVKHLPHFRSLAGDRKKKRNKKKKDYKLTNIPECCAILKKESMKTFLKGLPKDDRFDLHFIGTRGEESSNRRNNLFQRCRSYFIKTRQAYPIQACTPLSFWKKTDIYEYFIRYGIPKNPTYAIHDLERLGCKSCPAHLNWEKRLAKDPTKEGWADLKKNFEEMKEYEPARLLESCATLTKYLRTPEAKKKLKKESLDRCWLLIHKYTGQQVLA